MKIYVKKIVLPFFAALLAISQTCGAKEAANVTYDHWAKADSVINASIREGIIPGAVAVVVDHGKTIYHKAYGNRQIKPETVPMTEDVIFDMASCTKVVVTTTAVLQLYERGIIDLNAPVGKYLREFEGQDITVTDLLTHTAGFHLENWRVFDKPLEYVIDFLSKPENRAARGTQYEYSCANFVLLQQIVERMTGMRICDYAKANIFEPLGMNDSHFFPIGEPVAPEIMSRIAAPRESLRKGEVDDHFARLVLKGNAGNAGLFTTASDMAIFCSALMNGGSNTNGRILKRKTVKKMARMVDPRFGRALGWDISCSRKSKLKGHSLSPDSIVHGGYTGTTLAIDLKNKKAIIILANRIHPEDIHYDEWLDKREIISTYLGE